MQCNYSLAIGVLVLIHRYYILQGPAFDSQAILSLSVGRYFSKSNVAEYTRWKIVMFY